SSITGGTINLLEGARLNVNNSNLNNVTVNGDLDITGTPGVIINGLTLNGTALANNIVFNNTQTLGGNAIITTSTSIAVNNTTTLTLAPSVTVRNNAASPIIGGAGTLINQGIIRGDTGGGTIRISVASLNNAGTIEAAFGGVTISSPAFSNSGTLLASGGTLGIASGVNLSNTSSAKIIITGGALAISANAISAPRLDLSGGSLTGGAGGSFTSPLINWSGGTMMCGGPPYG